jgi:hypothetical protein
MTAPTEHLTDRAWKAEVATAVDGPGLPFRIDAAWVEARSLTGCADFSDQRTGQSRHVKVSQTQFPTAADRRAEIVRLLRRPA